MRELERRERTRERQLRVFEVGDLAGLEGLRGEWARLHEASGLGPFMSHEWLAPWARRIAPGARLRILCVRDGAGALVGLLPLALEVQRPLGRRVRRLFLLGETHVGSDHLDVLAAPSRRGEVGLALAHHLRDVQAGWDVLDLADLDDTSPTPGQLAGILAAPDWELRRTPRFACPWEPLPPGLDFDTFLAGTRRPDNYKRRLRWFQKQPGYRIEVARDPEALEPAASDFLRLHRLRWEAEGGSQGIRGAGVEAFHLEAMRNLAARGWLRLYTLRVGEAALASVYGIAQGGTFSYYQSGYDPAWRSRSPGLVLVGETFREALGEGLTSYDFLRGTEPYKSDWTRQRRTTSSFRLTFRHGPGPWLTRAEEASLSLRRVARALLPAAVVERVRRRRRRASALPATPPMPGVGAGPGG